MHNAYEKDKWGATHENRLCF